MADEQTILRQISGGGCGLNPQGRWPTSVTQSMGRDTYGQRIYEPAVGTNGLRPNEYIQYDPKTGQPTGQVNGPYGPNPLTGGIGGSGAFGQGPYVSNLPVTNPNTVQPIGLTSGEIANQQEQDIQTTREANQLVQSVNTWMKSPTYKNLYHSYDFNGIQTDMEKPLPTYSKVPGLDLKSLGFLPI
jgi:hypothetical protein